MKSTDFSSQHEANQVKLAVAKQTNATKLLLAHKEDLHQDRHKLFDAIATGAAAAHQGRIAEGAADRQGRIASEQSAQDAGQAESAAVAAAGRAQPVAALEDKRQEKQTTQITAVLQKLAESQAKADAAIAQLAETVKADIEGRARKKDEPAKPRRRTGKARLPSGQEMTFDMTDE